MSIRNQKLPSAFLAGLVSCGIVSPAWAGPNMWWDHFESPTPSQAECVKRAEGILNAEKAGQLSSSADSVRAWTEKTVAVTECIQFGDKLIVAVLVSSEDIMVGNTLFNALRAGMGK